MRSTFMGLEASKRGLFTQQSALYTTGHNISNANTLGFSRQRVNMEATLGFPGTGLNAPKTAGHLGTGVQAQSVQRIRDEFIDRQYRQESTKLGYWDSKSKAISQMEDIIAEPSEFGLNESLDLFWKSLQDLNTNPDNAGARKVILQRGQHVADSFNYMHKQLSDIQGNLGNEIKVSTNDINSKLKQIADLNAQIKAIEPNGYMPNDLYDARDILIDELSQYFPIEIERVPSGGNSLAIAEGSLTVKMKVNGQSIELINGKEYVKLNTIDTSGDTLDGTNLAKGFGGIQYTGLGNPPSNMYSGSISYANLEQSKGKLLSLIDSYGHGGTPEIPGPPVIPAVLPKGTYPDMLANLDKMANAFMEAFNDMHKQGFTLESSPGAGDSVLGGDFFNGAGAAGIKVNDDIIKDPNLIAASDRAGEEGNGKWAIELSNLKFTSLASLGGANLQSFYQGVIGQLGVDGEQAERLAYNSGTIMLTVENKKASVSAVSLDEEMTNMITFQQAYNANARMITVIDETLDKIINGMGRVGL
ncbi:flagellar hook-associated protein FlgK [Psychrobacillus sp.]|uniref:flagellar hook-associated protein FlgK n=1 Tax=Psychrobacillus sp. TaxID=1871623 RepID=UPI0028BF36A1|nr:flagellar hook-associated protein FlgK [Psychrobacillus sp.]